MRKAVGGGMRQSGILAAAGLYALSNNLPKLKRDNQIAQKLTEGKSIKRSPISIFHCEIKNIF